MSTFAERVMTLTTASVEWDGTHLFCSKPDALELAAEADTLIAALHAELEKRTAENAELKAVLTKAREDINWMVNSERTLNGFVFDYIDAAITGAAK